MEDRSYLSDTLLTMYTLTNPNGYYETMRDMVHITIKDIGNEIEPKFAYLIRVLNNDGFTRPIGISDINNHIPDFIDNQEYIYSFLEEYKDRIRSVNGPMTDIFYTVAFISNAMDSIRQIKLVLLKIEDNDDILIGSVASDGISRVYLEKEIEHSFGIRYKDLCKDTHQKYAYMQLMYRGMKDVLKITH
jgi:hypothetical protein